MGWTVSIQEQTVEGVEIGAPVLVQVGTVALTDVVVNLPTQTGNAGAVLGTDGTATSWVREFKSADGETVVSAYDGGAGLDWDGAGGAYAYADVDGSIGAYLDASNGTATSTVKANLDGTVEIVATGAATLNGTAIATATDVAAKAPTSRTISTTAPLSGGGDLSANRTLTIADATTSVKGAVQLTDSTSSTSTTTAATPNSVKSAYDLASAHKTRHATGGSDALSPSDIGAATLAALWLSGTSGNYVSCPDDARLDVTGDIDIRVRAALTDWTPAATMVLLAKEESAAQRSYRLSVVATTGLLLLAWSTDGSTVTTATSTAAPTVADGATLWVRATLDVDNGASGWTATFYTSTDGVTWTQLGSAVTTAGTTSIYASTSILTVGVRLGTATELLIGKVYRAQVRSGIGGTLVADWRGDLPGARTRDSLGNLWTVNGTANGWMAD